MQSNGNQKRSGAVKCVIRGALYGLIAGAVSGPVVVIAWTYSLHYLYPETQFMATGFEVPGSLIVGAILGAMEGPILGLLWAIRPPRLTLWWLMVAVAIVGLMLALFMFNPVLGLFAITVPVMMAVSTRVVAMDPPAAPSAARVRIGYDRRPQRRGGSRKGSDPRPQSTAWLDEGRTRWRPPPEIGNRVRNPERSP